MKKARQKVSITRVMQAETLMLIKIAANILVVRDERRGEAQGEKALCRTGQWCWQMADRQTGVATGPFVLERRTAGPIKLGPEHRSCASPAPISHTRGRRLTITVVRRSHQTLVVRGAQQDSPDPLSVRRRQRQQSGVGDLIRVGVS